MYKVGDIVNVLPFKNKLDYVIVKKMYDVDGTPYYTIKELDVDWYTTPFFDYELEPSKTSYLKKFLRSIA